MDEQSNHLHVTFLFLVLGFEPKAWHMLSEHPTTELHLQACIYGVEIFAGISVNILERSLSTKNIYSLRSELPLMFTDTS